MKIKGDYERGFKSKIITDENLKSLIRKNGFGNFYDCIEVLDKFVEKLKNMGLELGVIKKEGDSLRFLAVDFKDKIYESRLKNRKIKYSDEIWELAINELKIEKPQRTLDSFFSTSRQTSAKKINVEKASSNVVKLKKIYDLVINVHFGDQNNRYNKVLLQYNEMKTNERKSDLLNQIFLGENSLINEISRKDSDFNSNLKRLNMGDVPPNITLEKPTDNNYIKEICGKAQSALKNLQEIKAKLERNEITIN